MSDTEKDIAKLKNGSVIQFIATDDTPLRGVMDKFDVIEAFDKLLVETRDQDKALKALEQLIRNDECGAISNGYRAYGRQTLADYLDKRVAKRSKK